MTRHELLPRHGPACVAGGAVSRRRRTCAALQPQDKTLVEWDLLRNQHRKTLEGAVQPWVLVITEASVRAQRRRGRGTAEHRRCSVGVCTLRAGHTNVVWSVCLSKDGTKAISVGHDETIRYWDTMTGALLKTIKGTPGSGTHHTSTIYMIVVSGRAGRRARRRNAPAPGRRRRRRCVAASGGRRGGGGAQTRRRPAHC